MAKVSPLVQTGGSVSLVVLTLATTLLCTCMQCLCVHQGMVKCLIHYIAKD